MSPEAAAGKKLPLFKLAVVAVALVVVGLLLLQGVNLRALMDSGIGIIRDAGPFAFFTAMALLPVVGAPVIAFALTAGPAFSERLGTGVTVALALTAVTVNFLLAYFLARRALRPTMERLLTRLGYKLPQVEVADAGDLVVILRMTPGIPFFVQNYLAGLAEVPFRKYLFISCVIVWPMNASVILFGDALLHGKSKVAIFAGSLIVAVTAATHLVRKHYTKKKVST